MSNLAYLHLMSSFDVAIVGQGLAGTALAWRLRERGRRVLILDPQAEITSSRVAAGLLTPITGQRLAVSWRFAEMEPVATAFYRRVEAATGASFFHADGAVRLFCDDAERRMYESRRDSAFAGLVREPEPPLDASAFSAPVGGFEMPTAARLDTKTYLDASREFFAAEGSFRREAVHPVNDVRLESDRVAFPRLGIDAATVVFCTGFALSTNPWFRGVRFSGAKGEILTLRISGLAETRVVNRGVWLAPLGGGFFRAGSTYDRAHLDTEPTATGRDEILARLREFLKLPVEVVGHEAAVRPVVHEHRPLIGPHPRYPQIAGFTGLGSKGSLLAPYFADMLAAFLAGDREIEPMADVRIAMAANPHLSATEIAHEAVRKVLQPGEIAIDATAGNGHDTRFLAETVGPTGRVFAFDIQENALKATAERLAAAGLGNATLLHRNHADLADAIPASLHGRIGAAMFNLGYLPGGDKSITTQVESTVRAVAAGLRVLRSGGVLLILVYPGHPDGRVELDALRALLAVARTLEEPIDPGQANSPVLLVVRSDSCVDSPDRASANPTVPTGIARGGSASL